MMSLKQSKTRWFIRHFDWYAQPIYLTYRQDGYFRTVIGAICTIVSCIIIGWFSISSLLTLWKGTFNQVQNIEYIDVVSNPPVYKLDTSVHFNLGVRVSSYDPIVRDNINQYITPVFAYVSTNINTGKRNDYTYIGAVPCEEQDQDQGVFYCPNAEELEIYGQDSSQVSQQFVYIAGNCNDYAANPKTQCVTNQTVSNALNSMYADVKIRGQYINKQNATTGDPLGTSSYRFRQGFTSFAQQIKTYALEQNELSLYNSVFDTSLFELTNKHKYFFYRPQMADISFFNTGNLNLHNYGYFNLKFQQSERRFIETWEIITITNYIAQCGGYASTITSIIAAFIFVYQNFMYESSLTKRLYRVKNPVIERHSARYSTVIPVLTDGRTSRVQSSENVLIQSRFSRLMPQTKTHSFDEVFQGFEGAVNKQRKNALLDHIYARKQFIFKFFTGWLPNKMSWIFCCNKMRKIRFNKKASLYYQTNYKLYQELDIMEIIKLLRVSRIINKTFMQKYQREFVHYFHKYEVEVKPNIKTEKLKEAAKVAKIVESLNFEKGIDRRIYQSIITKKIDQIERFQHRRSTSMGKFINTEISDEEDSGLEDSIDGNSPNYKYKGNDYLNEDLLASRNEEYKGQHDDSSSSSSEKMEEYDIQ